MHSTDPLSASPESIPRRNADRPVRLTDVARAFLGRQSPKVIAGALVATAAARALVHQWTWRDAAIPLGLVALEPVTEWVIHVCLLHARPIRFAGRSYELLAAREHRAHHEAPSVLDGVLLPTYALVLFLPAIAATLLGLSFALHPLLGGDRVGWWLSGVVAGYAILLTYEWCHFLIHTSYRPRGRYYKVIWRNHRLHHFKNEHYWFGVTSNLGDLAFRTNPRQASVAKSQTARTLAVG
jgi:hypothetical protein